MNSKINSNDRKWIILKIFKRILNKNLSAFDRQYIFNSLYLLKKIRDMKDNNSQIRLTSESINYVIRIIKTDDLIFPEIKKKLIRILKKISDKQIRKIEKEIFTKLSEEIKEIDLKGKYDYYKKCETHAKQKINDFLEMPQISDRIFEIQNSIKRYISTRIDLGFSLKLMNNFIRREEKYLDKNVEEQKEKLFNNFFDKFKSNNVFKKEEYSIFIPLIVDKQYFSRLLKTKDIFDNWKIVRYSYAEKFMTNPINLHTKEFDKDCLYLGFLKVQGIDWVSLSNKMIWDKAVNYLAIFKIESINVNVNQNKPSIVLKHIKGNKTKIENFWLDYYNSNFIDTLFPMKVSYQLIKQLKEGAFGNKTSKFKSFLRAKSSFNNSINPIERINLSARVLELFLKYPFKNSYGERTKTERIEILSKEVLSNLLFKHSIHLILINKSAILQYALNREKKLIDREKLYHRDLKIIRNEILELKSRIYNLWTRNVVKEIQGTTKIPKQRKEDFKNFLNLASIFITIERNQQIHNKARYDLKDILLSEIVDLIVSTSAQNISYKLKKNLNISTTKPSL